MVKTVFIEKATRRVHLRLVVLNHAHRPESPADFANMLDETKFRNNNISAVYTSKIFPPCHVSFWNDK